MYNCSAICGDGAATPKEIEMEFTNIIGSDLWRWHARAIADDKYVMRFPNVKLLKDWSYFKTLTMRMVEAQIKIEPWTPNVGTKGELQQAWFRVNGIPNDQRSIRTVAKVGGLVGKVMEIDEKLDAELNWLE